MAIVGSDTPQVPGVCEPGRYWAYKYSVQVMVVDADLSSNSALTGGGLYFDLGGNLTVARTSLVNNSVLLLGGGLGMGVSGKVQACGGVLDGVRLEGNTAGRGGAQIHMGCAADLALGNSSIALGNSTSEVRNGPD